VKRSYSGFGLFTNISLQKRGLVAEYTGTLLPTKEADRKGGKYLFQINSKWTIDGSGRENISRYINHCCRPNCEPRVSGKRILIYAKKNIKPGQELTYDYGEQYFDEHIKPYGCKCEYCRKTLSHSKRFKLIKN
jgi:hypothetical protein